MEVKLLGEAGGVDPLCELCHTWKCVTTAISSGVDLSEVSGCHLL